jgi:hypothetical protein
VNATTKLIVVTALSPTLSTGRLAGADRVAVDMHGAGAAQRLAAAELGPGHTEHVS